MAGKKIKPRYYLIAALSLDGYIAKHARHFTGWTSPADKDFLHARLDASDCVIVGNNTYKTARQPLSKRNCLIFTKSVGAVKQASERRLYVNPAKVDVAAMVRQKGYRRIAVLGGTQIFSWFFKKNLLDEIYLTIEPVVFGSGLPLFKADVDTVQKFKLASVRRLNKTGTVLLHYTRNTH
ncbi:hypothetical protein A3D54_02375 [Candidatus Falkowbacteria bacterium RIFCSPHIGHO2_02_FULL_45_15]|uniref:Bacterial bifunctional deaminase-reductase C-terminal domain-containing protein n=1 Tax=Candidatus Falkowbacteria bacterium RIFCSPHIGHO2_02_FULL_45_15 TaxID=1797987 RepID=A0A1F5RZ64_9BACT|nr:MAG: hypothetical protein A3D54_02375 [Candidatus Falkowbacteria bacterium RIFCSPHIGHO2_02_FULL_45_15]